MTLTQLYLEEIAREVERTRRVLANVPEGRDDWKPHPKSMPLMRLAGLVATMPSWVTLVIKQNELELNPPGGPQKQPSFHTGADLVKGLDTQVASARESLKSTNDDFLLTTKWKLLFGGQTVMEELRNTVLRDTINHWSHHRGQLTVYLRLNNQKVPSVYGPTADDQSFG